MELFIRKVGKKSVNLPILKIMKSSRGKICIILLQEMKMQLGFFFWHRFKKGK